MPNKSTCIDGGGCYLATVKNGIAPCTKGCGISHAKNSWTWPRIVALANGGYEPCARVVARAISSTSN